MYKVVYSDITGYSYACVFPTLGTAMHYITLLTNDPPSSVSYDIYVIKGTEMVYEIFK